MSNSSFDFQAVKVDPSWKIGIIKSKWNHEIVSMLASEAVNHLEASGIKLIEIYEVPGSWELIAGTQKLISKCDHKIHQSLSYCFRDQFIMSCFASDNYTKGDNKITFAD